MRKDSRREIWEQREGEEDYWAFRFSLALAQLLEEYIRLGRQKRNRQETNDLFFFWPCGYTHYET